MIRWRGDGESGESGRSAVSHAELESSAAHGTVTLPCKITNYPEKITTLLSKITNSLHEITNSPMKDYQLSSARILVLLCDIFCIAGLTNIKCYLPQSLTAHSLSPAQSMVAATVWVPATGTRRVTPTPALGPVTSEMRCV